MDAQVAWDKLTAEVKEVTLLSGAAANLAWDQQTYMPKGSGSLRGQQLSVLSKLCHERATSPQMGEWLDTLGSANLASDRRNAIEKLQRDYDREVKIPSSLVQRAAVARSAGFEGWMKAKEAKDFSIFRPHLEELLGLAKEKAAAIDPKAHALQVLMEKYDPGVQIPTLKDTFSRLQAGLTELIGKVDGAEPRELGGTWPLAGQKALHQEIASALGYDFNTGRIDAAEHPFTISLGHGDTRITTHYYEDDLLSGLGGTIHETGHALYEQGLPADLMGTGLDSAASYGLHESQSRFWENTIGRSLPFFEWLMPKIDAQFPGHGKSAEDLYRAANRIQPGFIRVQADEVTYNLHIIVRFELELALFEGRLEVADLPDAWNQKYTEYLGITPPDDTLGVLQDVHWSTGSFAYFQSYTLGNLYAAAFGAKLREDVPDLDKQIRAGEFGTILAWLRDRVHRHGRTLDGQDRVRAVVGHRDYVSDLLRYLWDRHGSLYGLYRY
ncbi:MAG: carboxypeptidase M32 [Myxococcota bacterium]